MTLPYHWNAWRTAWTRWLADHDQVVPVPRPDDFPANKNLLADEILGYYRLPDGRVVELSEVFFPPPLGPDRCIGYTFAPWPDGDTGLVHSFAELDEMLGLAPTREDAP